MFKSHVASKLSVYEPETFFADGQGNQSKTETFYSLARYSETKRLGWVIKGQMMDLNLGPNAFLAKSGCGVVLTMFWSPKVGRGRPNTIR